MQEKIVKHEKPNEKSSKKVMILCIVTLLVVVLFAGVMLALNRNKTDELPLQQYEMSYEDFKLGMKENLSEETEKKVKEIYDKISEAMKKDDNKKIDELYNELDKLDIFDSNNDFSDIGGFDEEGSELVSGNEATN